VITIVTRCSEWWVARAAWRAGAQAAGSGAELAGRAVGARAADPVALTLCSTAHPRCTRLTDGLAVSSSEAAVWPTPRSELPRVQGGGERSRRVHPMYMHVRPRSAAEEAAAVRCARGSPDLLPITDWNFPCKQAAETVSVNRFGVLKTHRRARPWCQLGRRARPPPGTPWTTLRTPARTPVPRAAAAFSWLSPCLFYTEIRD
jgi:hypothetical protein